MIETVFIIISVVLLLGLAIPQLLWLIDINKEVKIYTEKRRNKMAKHTLQHMASGGCIDSESFDTYEEMEAYIDNYILPEWQEGDYIVCDGERRECFDDYKKLR